MSPGSRSKPGMETILTFGGKILRSLFGSATSDAPPNPTDQQVGSASPTSVALIHAASPLQLGLEELSGEESPPKIESPASSSPVREASVNPVSEKSNEQRLLDALDNQAVRFIEMLEDTSLVEGREKYDLKTKMQVFQLGKEWLQARRRLNPEPDSDDQSGIAALKKMAEDPAGRKAIQDLGFMMLPVKKPKGGRPTKAEAEQKARVRGQLDALAEAEQNHGRLQDDSGLRAMIGKTQ